MSPLNRGGLWIITQPAQQIFLKAECHFRQFTSDTDLQRLDISGITHNATSDSDICNLMISDVELELDSSQGCHAWLCKCVYKCGLIFFCQGYYSAI